MGRAVGRGARSPHCPALSDEGGRVSPRRLRLCSQTQFDLNSSHRPPALSSPRARFSHSPSLTSSPLTFSPLLLPLLVIALLFFLHLPIYPSLLLSLLTGSMRTSLACLIVVVALMASFAGGYANHGRVGIHSALDGRWPDLVGRDAEEAKTHILTERPNLNVQIVASGMMTTMDYNTNRVRLFVNAERKVVKCPTIG